MLSNYVKLQYLLFVFPDVEMYRQTTDLSNSNINCHFAYIYTVPLPKHLRVRDLLEVKYLGKGNEICKLQSCKCSLELTHIFDKSTIDTGITLLFTKILQKETEFLQQTLSISFKSDVVDLYFLKL